MVRLHSLMTETAKHATHKAGKSFIRMFLKLMYRPLQREKKMPSEHMCRLKLIKSYITEIYRKEKL